MFKSKYGFFLFTLLLALGAVQVATAKSPAVSRAITTVSEYRAGSPEVGQVKAWLQNHAEFANGVMVGDPEKLGHVRITYTKVAAGGSLQADIVGGDPPVSLPATGNPGDVISISSNSGGITQNWTYTWVGNITTGGWVLTDYGWSRNNPPGSAH